MISGGIHWANITEGILNFWFSEGIPEEMNVRVSKEV